MSNTVINKLIKTATEHHAELHGLKLTKKTIKLGTPNNAVAVIPKESLLDRLCKVCADVYCEENDLELVADIKE